MRFKPLNIVMGMKLLMLLLIFLAACETPTESPNEVPPCPRGIRNNAGDACVNASNCGGKSDACLDGFYCDTNNQCTPRVPCVQDSECNAGFCKLGACINPARCVGPGQCIPGDSCNIDTGVCIESACGSLTEGSCKNGGVCVGTQCVNREYCTIRTEREDCIPGYKCIASRCVQEKTCESVTCTSSDCLEKRQCVEATDCAGDDNKCRYGRFCDGSTCKDDLCVINNVQCIQGKACDRVSGICESLTECDNDDECLSGVSCYKDNPSEKGLCQTLKSACETQCPRTKVCERNDDLTVTCKDKEKCETALDCLEGKFCDSSSKCVTPSKCQNENEGAGGNNTQDNATVYSDADQNGTGVSPLYICDDDVDIFVFGKNTPFQNSGNTAIFELAIEKKSIGLGKLHVQTYPEDISLAPDKKYQKEYYLDAEHPTLTFAIDLSGLNQNFFVAIKDAHQSDSSVSPITAPGIEYSLKATPLPQNEAEVCRDIHKVTLDSIVEDALNLGDPNSSKITCLTSAEAADKAYRFTVPSRKIVKVSLAPKVSTVDVSFAIRRSCIDKASEVPGSCTNNHAEGQAEGWEGILETGTYDLVVTAPNAQKQGAYSFKVEAFETSCDPNQESCSINGHRQVCDKLERGYVEKQCQKGCQLISNGSVTRAVCKEELGKVCEAPRVVGPNGLIENLVLENQLGSVGFTCGTTVPSWNSYNVAGPETFYQVKVPPGYTLVAKAEQEHRHTVSGNRIYLVNDCQEIKSNHNCIETVASKEIEKGGKTYEKGLLTWKNNESTTKTLLLGVDTNREYGVASDLELTVQIGVYESLYCRPDERTCYKGRSIRRCNDTGTDFEVVETCVALSNCIHPSGEQARCDNPLGDDCSTALKVDGLFTHQDLSHYESKLPDRSCLDNTDNKLLLGGVQADRFYKVAADKGDLVRIVVKPYDNESGQSWNPLVGLVKFVEDGKTDLCDTSTTCMTMTNTFGEGISEKLEFVSKKKGIYYFVVKNGSPGSGSPHRFDLFAKALKRDCTGGPTCEGTTLKFCDGFGVEQKVVCRESCDAAKNRCEVTSSSQGSGETCAEPHLVDTSTTKRGTYQFSSEINLKEVAVAPFPLQITGNCYLPNYQHEQTRSRLAQSTSIGQRVAAFDLGPQELLKVTADILGSRISSSDKKDYYVYITDEMCDVNKCVGMNQRNVGTRYYYNSGSESKRVYVVVGAIHGTVSLGTPKLTYEVTTQSGYQCHPNSAVCEDDKVVSCDAAGQKTEYQCDASKNLICRGGACVPKSDEVDTKGVAGDKCVSDSGKENGAVDLGATQGVVIAVETLPSFSYNDTKHHLTSQSNVDCTESSIHRNGATGADFYAKVHLDQGHILEVEAYGSEHSIPIVRIGSACDDGDSTKLQCQKGNDPSTGAKQTSTLKMKYLADVSKDVYLRLDSKPRLSSFSPRGRVGNQLANYFLIKTKAPDCTAGEKKCEDRGSTGYVMVCKDGMFEDEETCNGACAATQDRCAVGSGKFSSPFSLDLTDATGTEKTHKFTIKKSDKDTTSTEIVKGSEDTDHVLGSCIFNNADFTGRDYTIELDLQENQRFEATLEYVKQGVWDDAEGNFYLVDASKVCITNDPRYNVSVLRSPRKISFEVRKTGKYYLIFDVKEGYGNSDLNFKLKYKVETSGDGKCQPGLSQCLDDTQLSVCNLEKNFETVNCPLGCVGRACRGVNSTKSESHNQCNDSNQGYDKSFVLLIPFKDLTNDVLVESTKCSPFGSDFKSVGKDLVENVTLKKGQKVYIRTTVSNIGNYASVYLVNSCTDANTTSTSTCSASGVNDVAIKYSSNTHLGEYQSDNVELPFDVPADGVYRFVFDQVKSNYSADSPIHAMLAEVTIKDAPATSSGPSPGPSSKAFTYTCKNESDGTMEVYGADGSTTVKIKCEADKIAKSKDKGCSKSTNQCNSETGGSLLTAKRITSVPYEDIMGIQSERQLFGYIRWGKFYNVCGLPADKRENIYVVSVPVGKELEVTALFLARKTLKPDTSWKTSVYLLSEKLLPMNPFEYKNNYNTWFASNSEYCLGAGLANSYGAPVTVKWRNNTGKDTKVYIGIDAGNSPYSSFYQDFSKIEVRINN